MSKNRILVGLTFLAGLCVFITGCQQSPKKVVYSKESATQTRMINFNTKTRSASREGEGDTEEKITSTDTLVAVVKNDAGEESVENVLEIPTKKLKLDWWCQPQPVREVYKCPYPTIEYEAKGFYTVFAGPIDWWAYEDHTPAPNVGQIIYVKPDGTVIDILNFENDVYRWATTWIKENDGPL